MLRSRPGGRHRQAEAARQALALDRLRRIAGPSVGGPSELVPGWVPGDDADDETPGAAGGADAGDDGRDTFVFNGAGVVRDADGPDGPHEADGVDPPRLSLVERVASRFGLSSWHVRLVAIGLALALVLAALAVVRARPRSMPVEVAAIGAATTPTPETASASVPVSVPGVTAAAVASATPAATPSPAATAGSGLVVDVVGRVRHAGVVRLPAGARVQDAIRAAGGAKPGTDTSSLNLARPLLDGEQVAVGVTGAGGGAARPATGTSAPGESGTAGSTPPAALVHLNTATLADLDTLPGVGPVLAQRILDFRQQSGGFTTVDELRQVSGIGDKTYADLAPRVAP